MDPVFSENVQLSCVKLLTNHDVDWCKTTSLSGIMDGNKYHVIKDGNTLTISVKHNDSTQLIQVAQYTFEKIGFLRRVINKVFNHSAPITSKRNRYQFNKVF